MHPTGYPDASILIFMKIFMYDAKRESDKVPNYRPISVLSFFSKIFEKIMCNTVVNFMDENDTFYQYQFGFRKSHSTQHAIITLVDKITSSLDSGDLIIGVFLDLKKTFDTVNHHILLKNCSVMASEVAL